MKCVLLTLAASACASLCLAAPTNTFTAADASKMAAFVTASQVRAPRPHRAAQPFEPPLALAPRTLSHIHMRRRHSTRGARGAAAGSWRVPLCRAYMVAARP